MTESFQVSQQIATCAPMLLHPKGGRFDVHQQCFGEFLGGRWRTCQIDPDQCKLKHDELLLVSMNHSPTFNTPAMLAIRHDSYRDAIASLNHLHLADTQYTAAHLSAYPVYLKNLETLWTRLKGHSGRLMIAL